MTTLWVETRSSGRSRPCNTVRLVWLGTEWVLKACKFGILMAASTKQSNKFKPYRENQLWLWMTEVSPKSLLWNHSCWRLPISSVFACIGFKNQKTWTHIVELHARVSPCRCWSISDSDRPIGSNDPEKIDTHRYCIYSRNSIVKLYHWVGHASHRYKEPKIA